MRRHIKKYKEVGSIIFLERGIYLGLWQGQVE
jgi:hypothetical protein